MGYTELSERGRRGSESSLKKKMKEIKMLIAEVCDELEDENYGEKRGYRVIEDDRYDERYSRRM